MTDNIKFCVKLGKYFTETHKTMQNAYGDQCLGCTRCYDWFGRYKHGRQSVDDDSRSGRPSTLTDGARVIKVNEIVRSNRRLTARDIAEDRNISVGSCHEILVEKLEMRCSKMCPSASTQDRKDNRVTVCQELLDRANDDEMFTKQIIAGDETMVMM